MNSKKSAELAANVVAWTLIIVSQLIGAAILAAAALGVYYLGTLVF